MNIILSTVTDTTLLQWTAETPATTAALALVACIAAGVALGRWLTSKDEP
jgi:hypothetical protein